VQSAIPTDAPLGRQPREARRSSGLSPSATLYFWLVVAAAVATALPCLVPFDPTIHDWIVFAVLATGAAIAQLFVVVTPGNQSYHATGVFLLPAALLLPPELVAPIAFVQHVPDWLKRRLPFHIQAFNIANYTLATLAAWVVGKGILGGAAFDGRGASALVAGAAASFAFVGVNHVLLAPMLRFARGLSSRDTGLFAFENLSTDLVLAALGVGLAALYCHDVWLVPFALAPLVLVHRSLSVPALQAEARVDAKTGLFNARHFGSALREELDRASRFDRPLSLIMADLDLLRDINNTYGHLAGDAVLTGIARIFLRELREYDVPARFGGEEFAILLPETTPAEAMRIAERIRGAVANAAYDVETSSEPIRATVSIGVAAFPRDGADANELVHQADVAVYRAKLQGRNRVLEASEDGGLEQTDRAPQRLVTVAVDTAEQVRALRVVPEASPEREPRDVHRPHASVGPRLVTMPHRLVALVALVSASGIAAGVLASLSGTRADLLGLVAIVALVALGQALSIEMEQTGTLSISVVGGLAGAAIVGPAAALPLAVTMAAIEWSARRSVFHQVIFNVGALTLASLAAAQVFAIDGPGAGTRGGVIVLGLLAGGAYFAVNTGLLSIAVGVEGRERPWRVWRERFSWLGLHYLVYGFVAAVIYEAYRPIGVWALLVFALPLLLMHKTQEAYVRHAEKAASKLREAAETIQLQNVSLEQVNRQLKERSTAAMESLSATVDARDSYTAGHSRRVQRIALTIGRELGMSEHELELLSHAALFHDIGKLAVPDAVLLKPASLNEVERALMARHAEEGASIINRLGFLTDAVPAIRHHHERYDGRGYPDGLAGEEIPLGARVIHVADAWDSMLSTRVYRPARSRTAALRELRSEAGTQFCPRCVAALEAVARREDAAVALAAEPVAVA
jgi:diguanylate cyclase (GGDEF)-like protein/putative nucleotidyltransferase with HDIG domain